MYRAAEPRVMGALSSSHDDDNDEGQLLSIIQIADND